MGLTGIQIFKLLPKTNCKECGYPTCLAFAMNLASGKAELASCPYVSDEAKEQLAEASAPPIRPVSIGAGVRAFKIGGETVMFRHEKTFYNPTGIAAMVSSDMDAKALDKKLKEWNALQYERVGLNLRPELVALKHANGDSSAFAATAKKIATESEFGLILMTAGAACWYSLPNDTFRRRGLIWVLVVLVGTDLLAVDRRIVHPERSLHQVGVDAQGRGRLMTATAMVNQLRFKGTKKERP